jgi:hypothetical protein
MRVKDLIRREVGNQSTLFYRTRRMEAASLTQTIQIANTASPERKGESPKENRGSIRR